MKTSDSYNNTVDYDASIEEHPKRIKGLAWLLSIFGIFGVCLLFAWLVSKDNSPLSSHGERYASAAQYQGRVPGFNKFASATPAATNQLVFVYIGHPTLVAPPKVDASGKIGAQSKSAFASAKPAAGGKTVASAGGPLSIKSQTKAAKPAPAAVAGEEYNDRIEREAREVIHGDYGNNPMRHDRLGADYDAVQARVNQILHNS